MHHFGFSGTFVLFFPIAFCGCVETASPIAVPLLCIILVFRVHLSFFVFYDCFPWVCEIVVACTSRYHIVLWGIEPIGIRKPWCHGVFVLYWTLRFHRQGHRYRRRTQPLQQVIVLPLHAHSRPPRIAGAFRQHAVGVWRVQERRHIRIRGTFHNGIVLRWNFVVGQHMSSKYLHARVLKSPHLYEEVPLRLLFPLYVLFTS